MKRPTTSLILPASKPRNPLHEIMASRKGGSHRKSTKSDRRKDNMKLQRDLRAGRDAGSVFSF